MITDTKMRLAARIQDLKCGHIKRPKLLNPKIEENIKGSDLLQIQEDDKVHCQEHTFQEVIDSVAVEAIIAPADAQYVEQLKEDYVGYKNQNIRTMAEQLQAWYVITAKEKLTIKANFLEPWSDTPDAHITIFARQVDRCQVKCKNHGVTVIKADKVDHFVAQMYACGLFEATFFDD